MPDADRYRLLVEFASDGMFVTDTEGAILDVNRRGCEMFGCDASDLLGKSVAALIDPENLTAQPLRYDLVSTDEPLVTERTLRRADGSIFDGEVSARVMPDGTVLGIVRDISRRKESERALKNSERRFRTLVEQSPLAMALYQADGTLIETNQASDQMWGIQPHVKEQLNGRYNILEDPQLVETGLMPFIRRGFDGEALELPVVHYDPSASPVLRGTQMREFWVRGHLYPVRNADDQIEFVVLIHEDVSALKSAEQDRVSMVEQVLETQKLESLGVLAGGVAHDFNNLLTSILGHASLVADQVAPGSETAQSLQAIEDSAEHAAALCRQLLAYAGKGQFLVESVDVSAEVEKIAGMLSMSVSKNATVRRNLTSGLPAIEADATQIRQIVMNLITNASDALGDEAGVIRLSTGTVLRSAEQLAATVLGEGLSPGRYVFIEVSDSGAGMEASTAARVFEPFFTTKFTGRGLGLAAVLGILRGHGGTIELDTAPGTGTQVRVLFPVQEEGRATPSPEEPGDSGQVARHGHLLVVDDDAAICTLVRTALRAQGYEVSVAADGLEGLAAFKAHRDSLCLVILDKTMPGATGDVVLREIRAMGSKIPAILSSGYSEDTCNRDSDLEPYRFLQKPYRTQELVALVEELLM